MIIIRGVRGEGADEGHVGYCPTLQREFVSLHFVALLRVRGGRPPAVATPMAALDNDFFLGRLTFS